MNKKIKIVFMSVFTVFLLAVIITLLLAFKNKQRKEEDKLYNTMNIVVKDYYKDYYYPNVLDNNEETAKRFKNSGITLSLSELAKYRVNNEDSILSQFKNYRTGANCNYDKTKIIIYPVEPYGSEDIRIEASIICGF